MAKASGRTGPEALPVGSDGRLREYKRRARPSQASIVRLVPGVVNMTTEPALTPAGLFFGSILRLMRNGATGFARGNALAEALSLTSTRACLHAREAMDRFRLIRYAPGERILQRPR